MKKKYSFSLVFSLLLFLLTDISIAQTQVWSSFVDSIPSLSSPRLTDLNNDGVKDVVIGGGTDSTFSNHGIMAFDGINGNLLWNLPSVDEVFISAQFQDINTDGIPDVFIGGRHAQLYAIDGSNGNIIWEFFPYPNPADSGLYNFYSPQLIPDVSGDLIPDLVISNGGDHAAPVWQTNRPPGHLMVINSANGNLIAKAVVPDSAETYCSPVVADIKNDGDLWVIYGTGGETLPGSMWAVQLSALLANDISGSVQLATSATLGFVAPASVANYSAGGELDIIIQAYDGTVYRINGSDFSQAWSLPFPGTESSAAPVIGNFTGSIKPDIFCVLYKGSAPSFTDFYQVMIDGETGTLIKKDSIGVLHFASANAFDANGDGRDEVLVSLNNHIGYFQHQLMLFDYQNNTYANFWNPETGVNVGCTPWVGDVDANGNLDVVYVVKRDSLNPMGWKGIYVRRIETPFSVPVAGIAWGSYMGTNYDGHYNYLPVNCGSGSILSGGNTTNPSCNGFSDGSASPLTANGTPPFTYLWSDGSVGASLQNVPAGTYSLQITDASGCFEVASLSLVDPFTISFGGVSHVLCEGGSNGQATVSSSGCVCMFSGCTFLWEDGNTTYTGTGLDAGPHDVTITHNNGCVVVATININDGAPLVDSVLLSNVSCNGFNDGEIEIIPTDSVTTIYSWSNSEFTSAIDSLAPGNYSLIIKDGRPCNDTLAFVVTEPDSLLLQITTTDILCNGDGNGEIQVTATGGNGGNLFYADADTSVAGIFSSLNGGNYAVFVLDTNGCSSDTLNAQVNEPASISTTMSSASESAPGNGTASVAITGGTPPYSQTWNDVLAQTTTTATGLTAGWYSVEITDGNGCTHIDSVEVLYTVGVDESGEKIPVMIYPNPAVDYLIIDFGSDKNVFDGIELYDSGGRRVRSDISCTDGKINITRGNLPAGNYFVRAKNETDSFVFKIVFN